MSAPRFSPFWRLLLCALGVVASSALVFGVMHAALLTSSRLSNRDPIDESLRFWADSKNILIATALAYPFTLLVLIVCRHALDGRTLTSLGLGAEGNAPAKPRPLPSFFQGALCGVLAVSFLFGILVTMRAVRIEGFSPEAFSGGAVVVLAMLFLYGLLFFAVGFMEELIFRGYALHNLAAWLGIPFAVAIQAIIFAFAHAGNGARPEAIPSFETLLDARWALLNIALVGWFFALAYLKSGTLWFPIGFHAAWNWALGCVWSLPVSGIKVFRLFDVASSDNAMLSGGAFGAEASILLAPILLAMIWILRDLPDHPQATRDLSLLRPPFEEIPDEPIAEVEKAEGANRPRLFKTSMRAEAAPEIAPAELSALTRELALSRQRAHDSAPTSHIQTPRASDIEVATEIVDQTPSQQHEVLANPAEVSVEIVQVAAAPQPAIAPQSAAVFATPARAEIQPETPVLDSTPPVATIPAAPQSTPESMSEPAPETPPAPPKKPRW